MLMTASSLLAQLSRRTTCHAGFESQLRLFYFLSSSNFFKGSVEGLSQGFDYLKFIRQREFPPHVVKLSISQEKGALFIQNGFKFCTNQCNEINHIVHEEIPESPKRQSGHWNSKFLKFLGPGGLVQYNCFFRSLYIQLMCYL